MRWHHRLVYLELGSHGHSCLTAFRSGSRIPQQIATTMGGNEDWGTTTKETNRNDHENWTTTTKMGAIGWKHLHIRGWGTKSLIWWAGEDGEDTKYLVLITLIKWEPRSFIDGLCKDQLSGEHRIPRNSTHNPLFYLFTAETARTSGN